MSRLLDSLSSLSDLQRRAVAGLIAASVGDAAARPLHWVYDKTELESILQTRDSPEFWPENKSPFYSLETGERSCYNHVVMAGLEAFIRSGGEPDTQVYTEVIRERFGAGTEWQEALERRKESYSPEKRTKWREPVAGPWLHGAIIHLLDQGGPDPHNTEMDPFLLAAAHLLLRADRPEVIEESCQISSLLTGNTDYARCQAIVLRETLLKGGLDQTVLDLLAGDQREATQLVFEREEEDPVETSRQFGNNCHLPGSFQGALHAFLHHRESEDRFQETLRAVLRAGGCNCSRANYAGALLGASEGLAVIPSNWLDSVNRAEDIVNTIQRAANISHLGEGK